MWLLGLFVLSVVEAQVPVDVQHRFEVDGGVLHVHVRGSDKSNPYGLFLHGGPGYSALPFMATVGPELERSLTMVYLDQRGCGQSSRLTPGERRSYTLDRLVKDIEEVRQRLGISKWVVIGHGWGGLLGLHYLNKHSDRVSAFISLSGIVSVPTMTEDILASAEARASAWAKKGTTEEKARASSIIQRVKQLRALPQSDPSRLAGAYALALNEAQLYFHDAGSEKVQAGLRQLKSAAEKYKLQAEKLDLATEVSTALVQNESFHTIDATRLLHSINVPTLLIAGSSDGVVTTRHLEIARRSIRGARLETLEACGHFSFYEQPERLVITILRFLAKVPLE